MRTITKTHRQKNESEEREKRLSVYEKEFSQLNKKRRINIKNKNMKNINYLSMKDFNRFTFLLTKINRIRKLLYMKKVVV